MNKRRQIIESLEAIEIELKRLGQWQASAPSIEALSSQQPFCVDTLCLQQWLQFILIPKMRELVANGSTLPSKVEVLPYAEEALTLQSGDYSLLLANIATFDLCFA